MSGELVGIGIGPGDPELLSLKAVRLLGEIPVVATIASDRAEPVAARIAAPHLRPDAKQLAFRAPMHADAGRRAAFYDEVASVIGGELARGRRVGVPCLGDPLFYGSFIQILERLAPCHPCSVVPGITAPHAASAALRLPLARGNEAVLVLPATLADEKLERGLASAETVVLVKLGRHLPRIRRLLAKGGRDLAAWIASGIGTPEERLAPLDRWEEPVAPYMSLLILRRATAGG